MEVVRWIYGAGVALQTATLINPPSAGVHKYRANGLETFMCTTVALRVCTAKKGYRRILFSQRRLHIFKSDSIKT